MAYFSMPNQCGIEKCAMPVMKSGKQHLTGRIKLPYQQKIRTLGEKEIYKYLRILEADTIIQEDMKKRIKNISSKPERYP